MRFLVRLAALAAMLPAMTQAAMIGNAFVGGQSGLPRGVPVKVVATIFNTWQVAASGSFAFSEHGVPIAGCESVAVFAVLQDSADAACTTTFAVAGSHSITATYSGDPALIAGPNTGTVTVADRPATSFYMAPGYVLAGHAFDVSAIWSGGGWGPVPTGTITFSVDGNAIPSCSGLVLGAEGSTSSCAMQGLVAGAQVRADYSGDLVYAAGSVSPLLVVDAPVTTYVTVAPSPVTAARGEPIHFYASWARGAPTNVGSYTFLIDGAASPECIDLAFPGPNGFSIRVTCTRADLPVGRHTVEVRYSGTELYAASSATASFVVAGLKRSVVNLDGDTDADLLTGDASGTLRSIRRDAYGDRGDDRLLMPAGTGWLAVMKGDFNGDGRSDILFEHADGSSAIWLMSGNTQIGGGRLLGGGTGWKARLVADFNGDGRSDILWEHTDGRTAIWLMNGATQIGGAILLPAGTGWHAKEWGDFDGDGRADIVWEHDDQSTALWLMNGAQQASGARLLPAATGWRLAAIADFDGDGLMDILWTHADGRLANWIMRGTTQVGGGVLLGAGTGFAFMGAADFDFDGCADLVLQKSPENANLQIVRGSQLGASYPMFSVGNGGTIVGVVTGDGAQPIMPRHSGDYRRFSKAVTLSTNGFLIMEKQLATFIGGQPSISGVYIPRMPEDNPPVLMRE